MLLWPASWPAPSEAMEKQGLGTRFADLAAAAPRDDGGPDRRTLLAAVNTLS
ncbi:hypothetical protein [Streptomyces brasiliensis]|uniref:Uncharacterized protein n=1 Tax=Streptomyces brasiliensis TaxID=1954 RepID=A0A917LES6_9ACTN|nr:hypothetical protein [Streptomyces brasiliensis]GGJ58918.1 hypothetical protein GCM10010121_082010 [Streptomyces brasiliensis]